MTHREALLETILANPADDGPRLIYAECIQEFPEDDPGRGPDADAKRAALIRHQIANPEEEYAEFILQPLPNPEHEYEVGMLGAGNLLKVGTVIYRRGFPDELQMTLVRFAGLFGTGVKVERERYPWPLSKVTLTDKIPWGSRLSRKWTWFRRSFDDNDYVPDWLWPSPSSISFKDFDSLESANKALSDWCVSWFRKVTARKEVTV